MGSMRVGDYVTYYFAGKYPVTGIVLKVWNLYNYPSTLAGTYEYTVEILEVGGRVSTFDIHRGDEWRPHVQGVKE